MTPVSGGSDPRRSHTGTILFGALLALTAAGASMPAGAAVIRVPADYSTIQAAVDHSHSGDEIRVAAGTYTGPGNRHIDFHGRDISVIGEAGPEVTIIDCGYEDRGFQLESGETNAAVIAGFTIRRGSRDMWTANGGGIYCHGASPTIRNCIITECRIENQGGGIYMESAQPASISDCLVQRNYCLMGGDDGGEGGGLYLVGPITVSRCTIRGNVCEMGVFQGTYGGGVFCTNGARLEDCLIARNTLLAYESGLGGGVYAENSSIVRCRILGNYTGGWGGGACIKGTSDLFDCVITGNAGGCRGGGVAVYQGDARISGCTIAGNTALINGQDHTGGGIASFWSSSVFVDHSVIWGNCAEQGREVWTYGTGEAAEVAYLCLKDSGLELSDVFDIVAGGQFLGRRVRSLDELVPGEFDRIVVTTFAPIEVTGVRVEELLGRGASREQILTLNR